MGFSPRGIYKQAIPVLQMLEQANTRNKGHKKEDLRVIKQKLYERILVYLIFKGIPVIRQRILRKPS